MLSYLYNCRSAADGGSPSRSRRGATVVGGWQIAGITTFRSGFSQTPLVAQDRCNCDRAGRMRADVVAGVNWHFDNPTPARFFIPVRSRCPPSFHSGTSAVVSSTHPAQTTSTFPL